MLTPPTSTGKKGKWPRVTDFTVREHGQVARKLSKGTAFIIFLIFNYSVINSYLAVRGLNCGLRTLSCNTWALAP